MSSAHGLVGYDDTAAKLGCCGFEVGPVKRAAIFGRSPRRACLELPPSYTRHCPELPSLTFNANIDKAALPKPARPLSSARRSSFKGRNARTTCPMPGILSKAR